MMNIDQARAGLPVIKEVKEKPDQDDIKIDTAPVFASQEAPLRMQVPDGWRSV
jgi:hypothetical protein